jgi:selenide, water dikinase
MMAAFERQDRLMQARDEFVRRDLVLIGGGHSHTEVIKQFGMKPMPGLRLTLLARDVHTPYSGMLPGFIAGHYDFDESHVDLRRLARFANARIYHTEAIGLDLHNREVQCADRAPVGFDLLSIDIGSRPSVCEIKGADQFGLPVKPIVHFMRQWEKLVERIRLQPNGFTLSVVGGGAGGVELILSMRHRLRQELPECADRFRFHLITDTPQILPAFSVAVRVRFERILRERGIVVYTNHRVVALEAGRVRCAGDRVVPADAVLLVTQAAAEPWLRQAGLATDRQGFVRVNDYLQSVSHPCVFAAGDAAAVEHHPRPKSGVFAVRQGPPLAKNLRRAMLGKSLMPYAPQRHWLSLISTGDRYAVGSRGSWSVEGAWVWRIKNWIDCKWVREYRVLPAPRINDWEQ